MKKIIAPVDFSATAENSAKFAASLAEFYGAELWLYHTYEIIIPVSEIGYAYVNQKEMQEAAEFELNEFKKRIQTTLKSAVTIHCIAENSTLTEGLTQLCDKEKPDLVVMGLSGKNALTRLVVGSNTIRTINHLSYPILVVPPKAEFIPVRKIGFACDFEKVLETTSLEPLKRITRDFNAELFVLNIIFNHSGTSSEKMEESRYVGEVLKEFKPSYQTVLSDDITHGINWFVEKEKLDWVAVIPKKHHLIEKLFKRSQTKHLLHHIHVPVLCVHD